MVQWKIVSRRDYKQIATLPYAQNNIAYDFVINYAAEDRGTLISAMQSHNKHTSFYNFNANGRTKFNMGARLCVALPALLGKRRMLVDG